MRTDPLADFFFLLFGLCLFACAGAFVGAVAVGALLSLFITGALAASIGASFGALAAVAGGFILADGMDSVRALAGAK